MAKRNGRHKPKRLGPYTPRSARVEWKSTKKVTFSRNVDNAAAARWARFEAGYTIAELAEFLEIHTQTLWTRESGRYNWTTENLMKHLTAIAAAKRRLG